MPPKSTAMKRKKEDPIPAPPYHSIKLTTPTIRGEAAEEVAGVHREPLTILAINANGIRSAFGKGLRDFLYAQDPDVICISETKLGSTAYPAFIEKEATADAKTGEFTVLKGYRHVFSCSTAKQGYASTAVFIRDDIPVLGFVTKMGKPEFDTEGRFIHVTFATFDLIHVYVPNSGRGSEGRSFSKKQKPANIPTRLEYEEAISQYIGDLLAAKKDVIYCGDLNVAHEEIDLYNPTSNHFNPGFTDEEREAFSQLLARHNLVDSFRSMHPTKVKYSWFSNFGHARETKHGWRIDYFIMTPQLFNRVNEVDILDDYNNFSDHVPIVLALNKSD